MNYLASFWAGLSSLTPAQGVQLFGAMMFVITVAFLGWAHFSRKSKIDLSYILRDSTIPGKVVTQAKFAGFIGVMSSTWYFVYAAVNGTLTDTYAALYLTILVAGKVAGDYIRPQRQPDRPPDVPCDK